MEKHSIGTTDEINFVQAGVLGVFQVKLGDTPRYTPLQAAVVEAKVDGSTATI